MINNSFIVKETRKVRTIISKKYEDQPDKYIDYLISKQGSKINKENKNITLSIK